MIQNDKLENYLFIRHKLFRINENGSTVRNIELAPWTKTAIEDDFGKGATTNIKIVKHPGSLSEELKDAYIFYLESKIYKWDKLM